MRHLLILCLIPLGCSLLAAEKPEAGVSPEQGLCYDKALIGTGLELRRLCEGMTTAECREQHQAEMVAAVLDRLAECD